MRGQCKRLIPFGQFLKLQSNPPYPDSGTPIDAYPLIVALKIIYESIKWYYRLFIDYFGAMVGYTGWPRNPADTFAEQRHSYHINASQLPRILYIIISRYIIYIT